MFNLKELLEEHVGNEISIMLVNTYDQSGILEKVTEDFVILIEENIDYQEKKSYKEEVFILMEAVAGYRIKI